MRTFQKRRVGSKQKDYWVPVGGHSLITMGKQVVCFKTFPLCALVLKKEAKCGEGTEKMR
jgi:hypothetical protein